MHLSIDYQTMFALPWGNFHLFLNDISQAGVKFF